MTTDGEEGTTGEGGGLAILDLQEAKERVSRSIRMYWHLLCTQHSLASVGDTRDTENTGPAPVLGEPLWPCAFTFFKSKSGELPRQQGGLGEQRTELV